LPRATSPAALVFSLACSALLFCAKAAVIPHEIRASAATTASEKQAIRESSEMGTIFLLNPNLEDMIGNLIRIWQRRNSIREYCTL
jgi:hypothetical protein